MDRKLPSELVASFMNKVYSRGLVELLGGNVSVRVKLGSLDAVLITPTRKAKDSLTPFDIALVLLDGTVIYGKPSSEYRLHIKIYEQIPNAYVVIHAHSPYTLKCLDKLMAYDVRHVEQIGACIAKVPKLPPGSEELAINVVKVLRDTGCRIAVLEEHGVVTYSTIADLEHALTEAFSLIEALENLAKRLC